MAEGLPLSYGKAAAAGAIGLVHIAYESSFIDDDKKSKLLDNLQNIQSCFAEIENRLIRGQEPDSGPLFSWAIEAAWKFRGAVEEICDSMDGIGLIVLDEEVRDPFSDKRLNLAISRSTPSSKVNWMRNSVRRLLDTTSDLLRCSHSFSLDIAMPSIPSPSAPQHDRYPSWIASGGIFGRDREKGQIVQWLTEDTAEDDPISVYALVGMAGMGKTTLAKMVQQDPRVSIYFDFLVWVPASVDFNVQAMTRVILEATTGTSSNINCLRDKLRDKKLLLILDDVWEENRLEDWKALVAPLTACKKGSRILLTTRMQSVADMAAKATGAATESLKLDELNQNDSLMLLKSRLPVSKENEAYADLLLIGEKIVKRIGGCPLVTSIVASWLGSHMESHHWITVLQKGWQHIESIDIIIESLRLSYDHLPAPLQSLIRYCSVFPKGYKFNKMDLLYMWTASRSPCFLLFKRQDIGQLEAEDFNLLSQDDAWEALLVTLERKSFFCYLLETESSNGYQNEYYVLHGLMHDFAQLVSGGECARVDSGDLHSINSTIRHLSIEYCIDFRPMSNFQFLRTLIIKIEYFLNKETELVLVDVLKSLRRLRVLYLAIPDLSHALDSVGSLTQLRYLFLSSCDESHLRKLLKLSNLKVFKLEHFTAKEADYCSDIHNLRCLRCLHVPGSMSSKIRQIGRLTTLQELHGFEIVENDGKGLSALRNLRNLRRLSLKNLQNVCTCEQAMEINLKDKQHLKFLSLSWNRHLTKPMDQDDRVIDNLEPNKQIQRLHIHGYNGVGLPFWIENSLLMHLVSLELEYCMKWKCLPSLQDLNSLKHLKLENLFQLEYIRTEPENEFETSKSENAWLPPFLSTLIVRWCPNLKELPAIPCTLELLILEHVQLAVLPGICQSGQESTLVKAQLRSLHIESCAHLISLDEGLLEQQHRLHSLTTLVVRHCERLRHLPKRSFTELRNLNSLEIVACPILRDVKTESSMLPTSLTYLELNPCGDIEVSILRSLQNLITLRRFSLFNCSKIEELPSVEVFETLKNLNDVSIARCKNLLSLGGLGAIASLQVLSILCCDKLNSSYSAQPSCSFKLQKLTIDCQALLSVEPLRNLRHTRELHICDDYAMQSFPGEWLLQNAASLHSIEMGVAESLLSLPSEIEKLGSLQSLCIERAPLIQSLPQLPDSLSKLVIWGCDPIFLKRYERDVGRDWDKIAHIASVDISAYSEDPNYGDDPSQDFISSTNNPYRQFVVID